jgi:hypothetical protein
MPVETIGGGEQFGQGAEGATEFVVALSGDWHTLIDCGRHQLVIIRQLPEKRAAGGGGGGCVGLRRPRQQMQTFRGGRYQTLKQGRVHAVEVLQRVQYTEGRAHVKVQSGVTAGSEVDQDGLPVILLQGCSKVHREGCGACPTLFKEPGLTARP